MQECMGCGPAWLLRCSCMPCVLRTSVAEAAGVAEADVGRSAGVAEALAHASGEVSQGGVAGADSGVRPCGGKAQQAKDSSMRLRAWTAAQEGKGAPPAAGKWRMGLHGASAAPIHSPRVVPGTRSSCTGLAGAAALLRFNCGAIKLEG